MSQGPNTPGDQGPGDGAPPPPPAPQDPGATTGAAQPADLGTRFLAKLIDWVLIVIVMVPIGIVLALIGLGMGAGMGFGFDVGGLVSSVITSAIVLAYFALMEANKGQTVGKMLLKLQVRGPSGGPPSTEQAIKRNAYVLLPIIPFLGGLAYLVAVIAIAVTINGNSQTGQGWHDQFAGTTQVVKIG